MKVKAYKEKGIIYNMLLQNPKIYYREIFIPGRMICFNKQGIFPLKDKSKYHGAEKLKIVNLDGELVLALVNYLKLRRKIMSYSKLYL